jgi:hypothetical protein
VEQLLQSIVDRILDQPETVAAPQVKRWISERIAEIMADVPPEEFAELPRDGARQLDHYIYGLPKRD